MMHHSHSRKNMQHDTEIGQEIVRGIVHIHAHVQAHLSRRTSGFEGGRGAMPSAFHS